MHFVFVLRSGIRVEKIGEEKKEFEEVNRIPIYLERLGEYMGV